MNNNHKFLLILPKIIPYFCIFAVAFICAILYAMGKLNLLNLGLYLAIPIVLVSIVAIFKKNKFDSIETKTVSLFNIRPVTFFQSVLLYIFLFLISIYILFEYQTRPIAYFIIVGLLSSLIFLQTISRTNEHDIRKPFILIEVVLLFANLLFGQTLKLPFFFGSTDIITHQKIIADIINSGHIMTGPSNSFIEDYQFFPLFHIYNAISTILTGLDLQFSYFLFNGLTFIVSVPLVYLLFDRIKGDETTGLTTALFYSISSIVIFNGMYATPRQMAFVIWILILYLLVRSIQNKKLRYIAILLDIPLILIHSETVVFIIGLLALLFIVEFYLWRQKKYIGFKFPLLLAVATIIYWVTIANPFFTRLIARILSITQFTAIPLSAQISGQWQFLLQNLASHFDLMIIAGLSLFGILIVFSSNKNKLNLESLFVIFSFFIAFPLYFPGPANLFSTIALTERLSVLVSPFIAFVSAIGLLTLASNAFTMHRKISSFLLPGLSIALILVITLSSTIILANTTDLNLKSIFNPQNSLYFTKSELQAFSFFTEQSPKSPVVTDYYSSYYFENKDMQIIKNLVLFEPDSMSNGFMILRSKELNERGQLPYFKELPGSSGAGFVDSEYMYKSGESLNIETLWNQEERIYDNNSVIIFSIRPKS